MEQLVLPASEPEFETATPAVPSYPTIAESWGALGWFVLMSLVLGGLILSAAAVFHLKGLPKLVLLLGTGVATNGLLVLWLRRQAGAERWLGLRWRLPRRPWVAFGLATAADGAGASLGAVGAGVFGAAALVIGQVAD